MAAALGGAAKTRKVSRPCVIEWKRKLVRGSDSKRKAQKRHPASGTVIRFSLRAPNVLSDIRYAKRLAQVLSHLQVAAASFLAYCVVKLPNAVAVSVPSKTCAEGDMNRSLHCSEIVSVELATSVDSKWMVARVPFGY